ncbi:hypothetical protein FCM35_KLT15849 [Carex littledalei]|uniref:Uncharacterized protein n=1 Tax=Carex littledalei TaxID=544730 RepID=A0A833VXR0_9POAL|nr:hypothetical protein FCM35_KLT15849 [Carex littledalei]
MSPHASSQSPSIFPNFSLILNRARFHEQVFSQHKWPESLETDFIYRRSSSVGNSVNTDFLAGFSAAEGWCALWRSVGGIYGKKLIWVEGELMSYGLNFVETVRDRNWVKMKERVCNKTH